MRARRTREQWAALAAAFERSKQTAAAFCASHDLNESTFSWWRSQLRRREAPAAGAVAVQLLAVDVAGQAAAERGSDAPIVIGFGGLAVRVEVGTDTRYVAALVSDLRTRC